MAGEHSEPHSLYNAMNSTHRCGTTDEPADDGSRIPQRPSQIYWPDGQALVEIAAIKLAAAPRMTGSPVRPRKARNGIRHRSTPLTLFASLSSSLLPRPPRISHEIRKLALGIKNHLSHTDCMAAARLLRIARHQQLVRDEPINRTIELRGCRHRPL